MSESNLITELRNRIERQSKQAADDCRQIARLRSERDVYATQVEHLDRTIEHLYQVIGTPANA